MNAQGKMRVLVTADLTRLPGFDADAPKRNPARNAAVNTAMTFMVDNLTLAKPHCVLSHDDGETRVVKCPLLGESAPNAQLAATPLYRLVGYTIAHFNTFEPRNAATTHAKHRTMLCAPARVSAAQADAHQTESIRLVRQRP